MFAPWVPMTRGLRSPRTPAHCPMVGESIADRSAGAAPLQR